MNPHHTGSGRGRSYRPCLERLEDRHLPSVNFAVVDNTLVVTAPTTHTHASANITIIDNGTEGPNNVVAIAATPFFPAVTINNVVFQLGRDNDNVTYLQTGPLSGSRFVFANLSTGKDSFHAVGEGGLLSGAALIFSVSGNPRRRGDTITGQFTGPVQTGATLVWTSFGTSGNNVLGFNMVGDVAPGGTVSVSQFGGMGSAQITTWYGGVMNGAMGLVELGGQAGSNLFADVEFKDGSTGELVPSVLNGNDGDDELAFLVHDPTHEALIYNQVLNGGAGANVDMRTSNVLGFNGSIDAVMP